MAILKSFIIHFKTINNELNILQPDSDDEDDSDEDSDVDED